MVSIVRDGKLFFPNVLKTDLLQDMKDISMTLNTSVFDKLFVSRKKTEVKIPILLQRSVESLISISLNRDYGERKEASPAKHRGLWKVFRDNSMGGMTPLKIS